jgi:hypothetical protein
VLKDVISAELVEQCRALLLGANDDLREHGRVGREGFYSEAMQNLGVGGAHNTKRLFDIIELEGGPEVLGEILERTDARLNPILEAVLGKEKHFLSNFLFIRPEPVLVNSPFWFFIGTRNSDAQNKTRFIYS